jgi:hypothetical protein
MKKFYEIPVVEITVFDVEDVITASAGTVSTNDVSDINAFIDTVEEQYTVAGTQATVGAYSSYQW